MPGYLLDTNHVSAWEQGNPEFSARARSEAAENILWVCPITIGEIESGLRTATPIDEVRQAACRRFLTNVALRFVHPIADTTGSAYAEVLEQVYKSHPRLGTKTQEHLTSIGVDVNDLWIAAVAIEHNLILLTGDRMNVIRECVSDLRVDSWLG